MLVAVTHYAIQAGYYAPGDEPSFTVGPTAHPAYEGGLDMLYRHQLATIMSINLPRL